MQLYSRSEMLASEKRVIEQDCVDAALLMENAGSAVVACMCTEGLIDDKTRIAVFCGTGNNGADGLVVARRLISLDVSVDIYIVNEHGGFRSTEGELNLKRLESISDCVYYDIPADFDIKQYDVVVDALLGGTVSNSNMVWNALAYFRNAKKLVAVDIPSHVCATTGRADTSVGALKYCLTVTFGHLKWGLFECSEKVGKIVLSKISFPMNVGEHMKRLVNVPKFGPRQLTGHKGSFGKCRFYCGAPGYYGAPYFACAAFLKSGGGYAKLVSRVGESVAAHCPEIVIEQDAIDESWPDVTVMGCGSGSDFIFPRISGPTVIDGDGLTKLSENFDTEAEMFSLPHTIVLTPHHGELVRLFPAVAGLSSMHERAEFVQGKLAKTSANFIVVMKGWRSVVVSGSEIAMNIIGNPGMATPGSGDVFAGVIAAMLCRGDSPFEAVCNGVFVHGLAGDLFDAAT